MNRTRFKIAAWVLIALTMLFMAAFVVRQIGSLISYFQEGADPASALNIQPNKPLDWPVELTWRPDANDSDRVLEPVTREQIEAAYIRAWLQWHFSHTKGEPFGLATSFTGPALLSVEQSVEDAAAQGLQMIQADTRHDLELTYYALDGSIVAFTDHHASLVQQIVDEDGEVLFSAETHSTYDVIMLIDNGRWRIRHILRTDSAASPSPQPAAPLPATIAGVNYYPQDTPWDLFWTEYDSRKIGVDLDRINALGLNAARIFIPYEQFGADAIPRENLRLLRDYLDQAEARNIGVIVTLFDFFGDYNVLRWNHADRHLETLLSEFGEHPAVLAWDLKNEPDLDYDSAGQQLVDTWLNHVIAQARRFAPQQRLTIGWANPEAAATHADMLDFVSFHYYRPAEELADHYARLQQAVGNRPILLTEFGLPTWNSFFFPNGHSEAEQARYYADLLQVLREVGSDGYLAWTLFDFSHVPSSVVGRLPWRKGPQRQLGLIDEDGNAKLAAQFVAHDADLSAAPSVAAWQRFTKPFWLTVGFIGLCGLLIVARWLRRRKV